MLLSPRNKGEHVTTEPTKRTRLKRVPERGSHDRITIDAILDAGMVCHIGFVVDGSPVVIPTLYARRGNEVLFHGSAASRMLRALLGGLDVCLTVTHIDGIVLARSAFHHSMNYRSVVLFGTATKVTESDSKRAALDYIVESLVPGRIDHLRPMTDTEVRATTVLTLPIDEASAKIRSATVADEPEDEDPLMWAGVIPVSLQAGPPQADPVTAQATSLPRHVADWRPR